MHAHDDGQMTFSFYLPILNLEPLATQLHPHNVHNAPMSRHKSGPQRAVSPIQSGYCEAQACEICLWSCLGMRDYGGFRLRSAKLYVRILTDGEIRGEQRTQWSFTNRQMRGPKFVERIRIPNSVHCGTSKCYVVC